MNGYHELDMLMQSVSLADRLTFQEADELSLSVDHARIPTDERNLVYRAALAMQNATGCGKGAAITLYKEIPSEAGMGGGSSDAAVTLRALNLLWNQNCTETDLESIGLSVGADVPFCVRGGLQRVRGIGEQLVPLLPKKTMHILALQPCRGLSTREVFRAFREQGRNRIDTDGVEQALLAGDCEALGRLMGNALEPAAIQMRPEIQSAINLLLKAGACGARMTGSGSMVFGLYSDADSCCAAMDCIRPQYPNVRALHTMEFGNEIVSLQESPRERRAE